jgi:hypothetical protein
VAGDGQQVPTYKNERNWAFQQGFSSSISMLLMRMISKVRISHDPLLGGA